MADFMKEIKIEIDLEKELKLSPGQTLKVDDPEWDGTDFAHPAWWRGNDAGVIAVVNLLNKALDDHRPPSGGYGCQELTALRNRILAIRDRGDKFNFSPFA